LTALVPQLRRQGENNSLWLWSLDSFLQPLHAFVGHQDVILEFGWRKRADGESHIVNGNENASDEDVGDYELVTWSKDNSLRIWKVGNELMSLIEQVNNLRINQEDLGDDNVDVDVQMQFDVTKVTDKNEVQKYDQEEIETEEERSLKSRPSSSSSSRPASSASRPTSLDVQPLAQSSQNEPQSKGTFRTDSPISPMHDNLNISSATSTSASTVTPSTPIHPVPSTLEDEFTQITEGQAFLYLPNLKIEEMSAHRRVCMLNCLTSKLSFKIKIFFPSGYPQPQSPPNFQFLAGTSSVSTASINEEVKKETLKI